MRGFAGIGLFRPKDDANVGGALRAAHCYGASLVVIAGARGRAIKSAANTTQAHRHVPTIVTDDVFCALPYSTEVVCVDLIEGAQPLPDFNHPERALYVFGPEDGTLGKQHTARAQHIVSIPTQFCMNLAATVNVVLYDRIAKRGAA
jgi:tRNA(Leu) C34 or U34 (ribose-2'-O)-methylase TrmL